MDKKELRTKTKQELLEQIDKIKADIKTLMINTLQGKEKNVTKMRFFKRDIARINTILREK
ncbi:50S ribosomal protein L29 [candidate division WWE3 bacterium RIFOXYC1_FULL_40_10]|uniref:Large ribosomal subunit protein uL29 n=1 Tax=candidate division WWE3 bacterium RIFOXYA2_FULL_46_9 TaxID=1802636 RepID=A0A1F4VYG2_UNCKA|nr:MAG: 50S ribosomal protein L29 [candidate division WWE3 bacterium RIFOXYB1_FULL_40_22]OGC61861.1 MAG: 50S ribosomal protein L29 [candidate division WWE3 bacterium RIFOXYA1_FULL_40_11]OGC62227.1 MAG: 50S ribosomal protein L29 [candidate division WWE3 bacterium RIFOXYA2_FULL_46_9]OGC64333.1 MAG: 50S ribosomal protein L29 [candidate division WWE3 bacterium RIFOXYB2_FULL_41_6]OGC66244.1 MAG: 50S ribosomal protein L29 [candidate division WWE3 bacterium RIFOXYC1_FULL_40_10]OGC67850.1 MAG: 50S rib